MKVDRNKNYYSACLRYIMVEQIMSFLSENKVKLDVHYPSVGIRFLNIWEHSIHVMITPMMLPECLDTQIIFISTR